MKGPIIATVVAVALIVLLMFFDPGLGSAGLWPVLIALAAGLAAAPSIGRLASFAIGMEGVRLVPSPRPRRAGLSSAVSNSWLHPRRRLMSGYLANHLPHRPILGAAPPMTGEDAGVARSQAADEHPSRAVLDGRIHTDTDEELLLLAARGNREAFVALHDRMARLVSINVYRVLLDGAQSDAVTEETFAELFGHPINFDAHRDRAQAWVLKLAHQRATDRLRGPVSAMDAPGTS